LDGKKRLIDDFTISNSDDAIDSDSSAVLYREQLNEQKIEKLGNRVTIIAVLLPCLICAILVYGYLDIKKRVLAINDSGQSQVDIVATQFEARLNAFEVELAKIRFSLEKEIPEVKQQTIAIQDELTLIDSNKSSKDETEKQLDLMRKDIEKVAEQYKGALHILDRTNQETLTIVNEKSREIESKIESEVASIKAIEAGIEAKVASLKGIEEGIDGKIDSRIEAAMDKKIRTAINDKVAAQSQILNRKVADIELTVESKLATLAEATQILAENRSTITELENSIGELDKSVALMDKEFKKAQTAESGKAATASTDKKYVDAQLIALKKSLNGKIDQLDLTLSRKILQYATQLEDLIRQNRAGTKKKTESTAEENSSESILIKPERGKISETDLTQ